MRSASSISAMHYTPSLMARAMPIRSQTKYSKKPWSFGHQPVLNSRARNSSRNAAATITAQRKFLLVTKTCAHGSSWQSLTRRTSNVETEQLNGDVVTLGRMLGIETPYNELLWRIADEMALHREKPGKYTAEELMDMVQKRSS